MTSKLKLKEAFQKTGSFSETTLENERHASYQKSSLLDEEDLSVSDEELEKYLGAIKKKSGLNNLWTGNTFDKVIDRTPDVSISSVSEMEGGEERTDEENEDDFRPKIFTLPASFDENAKSDIFEQSSMQPIQSVHHISEQDHSDIKLKLASNIKLNFSDQKSVTVSDIRSQSSKKDVSVSNEDEPSTLDDITERSIEEDINIGYDENISAVNSSRSSTRRESIEEISKHSSKSKTGKRTHHKRQRDFQTISKGSTSSRTSHKLDNNLTENFSSGRTVSTISKGSRANQRKMSNVGFDSSNDTYSSNFDESMTTSNISHTKTKSHSKSTKERRKNERKARLNEQYRDVGIQVNMGDTIQPRLHVGMATLGQKHGHPSPIAQHVVDADQVEAVTTYNPAIVALTDMLRQQLKLVEQFVENSHRMYESYTRNLNTTYQYTTLEGTLEYIDKVGEHCSRRT